MINLLLLLLLLTCLGITAAWVAENPGSVTIHWFDYQVDTSFAFLLVLALALAVLLACAVMLLRWLIGSPARFRERRGVKQYRRGLSELTWSVAALAASDITSAQSHMRKAESVLGQTPLTLLLAAQITRSRGDDEATRLLLEQMLGHKETEYLAARSLSDASARQQSLPAALAMAQRAHDLSPKGILPLVGLHIRLHQWQEAQIALNKAMRRGHITRSERRRYRGLVTLQQGLQLLTSRHLDAALSAARDSLKDLPGFTPAMEFAARAYSEAGKKRKAAALHKKLHVAHMPGKWLCNSCGHSEAQWNAICPDCGSFDTLEWK